MAVSHLCAAKKISEACQGFTVTEAYSAVRSADLSPNNTVLFLVAQYGIEYVLKVCSALSRQPETLPRSQKESIMQEAT